MLIFRSEKQNILIGLSYSTKIKINKKFSTAASYVAEVENAAVVANTCHKA